MKPLSEQQHVFVTNYIKNGYNAYGAALEAGYSQSMAQTQAYKMVNRPHIKDRIDKAMSKLVDKQDRSIMITIQDKANLLQRIIDDVIPKDGSEPKRQYYKDALKAIAELNKMQGDYMPERRLSVTVDATKDKLKDVSKAYDEY